jgi:hypothetical protein
MSDPQLRGLLGADPPDSVLALDAAARQDLADEITAALRRQARDLQAAYDASMRHVPFPVRGIVKKVLGA